MFSVFHLAPPYTPTRRRWTCSLSLSFLLLGFLFAAPSFAAKHALDQIASTRVWPAQDYTRVTFESGSPLRYNLMTLHHPDRLVLDIQDVTLSSALQDLAGKIGNNDPYVKAVRIGKQPNAIRLVFDLQTEVKPQAFALKPIAEYGYRLVLDLYPAHPADPLVALLHDDQMPASSAAPASAVQDTQPKPALATSDAHVNDINAGITVTSPPTSATTPTIVAATPTTMNDPLNPPKPTSQHLIIVAIDAGHGGEDPGAHGRHGTREKNVTLAIARKLKTLVDAQPGMRGVLTRDGDYFIPLAQRVEKARKMHADLFVSVHADAFVRPDARGSSVFALSEHGATSKTARILAQKENESDLIGGANLAEIDDPYLKLTLTDLSFTAQINDSLKLAHSVLASVGDVNTLHTGHVEQAGFAVLKAPDIPSILVETAFISNPDEERKLKSEDYQEKIAGAIFSGIKHYFAQNPPLARGPVAFNP